MRTILFIILVLSIYISNPKAQDNYAKSPKGNAIIIFSLKSPDGFPINGAEIHYQIFIINKLDKSDSKLTDNEGKVTETINDWAVITVKYQISKDGFCPIEGEWNIYGGKKVNQKDFTLFPIEKSLSLSLYISDYDGIPVKEAKTDLVINYSDNYKDKFSFKSDNFGLINAIVTPSEGHIEKPCTENLDLSIAIEKPGYDRIEKKYDTYSLGDKIVLKFTLSSPDDYFKKDFLNSKNKKLYNKINEFIDYLVIKSILSNCVLMKRSVGIDNFKAKKYITFSFESMNVYNSIKYNKYDIGKLIFDEVIRKVLEPLNNYLFDYSGSAGYDLIVKGYTKSFVNDSDVKGIEYRFIIPKEIATKYKNKDISGQTVLDKSIILMDDERIELKLQ